MDETLLYFLKLLLASIISGISLITNSQEGVIGSMLISPLGLIFDYIKNKEGILFILIIIVCSIILMFFVGFAIGQILKYTKIKKDYPTNEIKKRHVFNIYYTILSALFVSICYAIYDSNSNNYVGIVGVGVAISLLPPIVNAGLTLGFETNEDKERNNRVLKSLSISGINFLCMIIVNYIANANVFQKDKQNKYKIK